MEHSGRRDGPLPDLPTGRTPHRSGGPLVLWLVLLAAIPALGLGVLAAREVDRNRSLADAAHDAARTVEEQTASINVFTPLQIERIGALGEARLTEIGVDPVTALGQVAEDYLDLRQINTPVLDQQLAEFAAVVDAHDFGDRPDLRPEVSAAIDGIAATRDRLAAGTATVDDTRAAYDAMLRVTDEFLDETSEAFRSEHPSLFDAQRLLRQQDINRLVIRTASIETALYTEIVMGVTGLDLVELVTAQAVHDEALFRADSPAEREPFDRLVDQRAELEPLSSIWADRNPVTPEAISITPDLYEEFATLLVERLEYLEAVEEATIAAGTELVAQADAEVERIDAENRRTMIGLTAIGFGILIVVVAIIRSITRPLGRLRRHAERIGGGDLAVAELPLEGPSDIRRVTGAVNDMTATLDAVDRQLTALAAGTAASASPAPIPGEVGASIRESVDRLVGLTGDLRAGEEQLQFDARHDVLTTRLNRFGAVELIAERLADAARSPDSATTFAVLIVDLDGFKNINDTRGKAVGDQLLCEVADRLDALVGDAGRVARVGGDEFLVVAFDPQDGPAAIALGRQMIETIEAPFRFNGYSLSIRASVGAHVAAADGDALDLVERASAAVHHAKQRGRGRVETYDADLQESIERSAEVELQLRDGIAAGDLVLHLQPTADAVTGRAAGAEAVVRWNRDGHGLVFPDDFIPIAERSGLVIDVGRWVLNEACALIADWKQRHPTTTVRLAVNISGRHLVEADLVADVDAALAANGADPAMLEIELTESHLLEDLERVSGVLGEVRARGVAVAVDDFGSGYSSMTYLQLLPLDAVKIDGRFVRGVTEEGFDAVVVQSVVRLAGELGLDIIAEGVETTDQINWLTEHGVHRFQGFLIARPLPVHDAEPLMFNGPLIDVSAAHSGPRAR